jgi:hypothetical protein
MQSTDHFRSGPGAVVIFLALAVPMSADAPQLDLTLAERYFQEARVLSERDHGELWGMSLDGPMLFVDPSTRRIVANEPDKESKLKRTGAVYVGHLPEAEAIGNRSITWGGVRWTMVMWPLPTDKTERAALMMHESWHRIQDKIGFPATSPSNKHLDTVEGRLWLQLEWRALAVGLRHEGAERNRALEDALVFRNERRRLFKEAADQEQSLEMREGLAEYTGFRLCGLAGQALRDFTAQALEKRPSSMSTFVRSFAYLSGPAYGILLDSSGVPWRRSLKPTNDLGILLASAFDLHLPASLPEQAEARMKRYQGEALRLVETDREKDRQKRIAEYRARLVDGPVLVIPLQKMQFSFDPTNLQPLEGLGTVYPNLRISDLWGILTVRRGALMNSDFSKIQVTAPDKAGQRPVTGDGWRMELKEGWDITPGRRHGDYLVVRKKG